VNSLDRTAAAKLTSSALGTGKKTPHFRGGDLVFSRSLAFTALALILLLLAIVFYLYEASHAAIARQGVAFFATGSWDPVHEEYGALPVIYGTAVSSLLALLLAAPLSIAVALFLTELAPRRLGRIAGFLVEMLAAIPSVVYGLWGIFVLAPWLRTAAEPALKSWLGFLPFFQGTPYGAGMLAAGTILAIMIAPTIASLSREVFSAIPRMQREAALALGATRTEAILLAVLKSSKPGIMGACFLGLGRALGETMAVTMVIGNRHEISASLFAPSATMASIIANEYAEATSDLHLAALAEVGLALFFVTFLMNGLARLLIRTKARRA
jgi:phosphate transport system permease protein